METHTNYLRFVLEIQEYLVTLVSIDACAFAGLQLFFHSPNIEMIR